MNKVSVIIPFYNRSLTISRAINSVLLPNNKKYVGEIIIVDDGSEDSEYRYLERYVNSIDSDGVKCRIIRYNCNINAAHARNIGIVASENDVIAFLDSDDEWIDGKIEAQQPYVKEGWIVFSQFQKINANRRCAKKNVFPNKYNGESIETYILHDFGHVQTSTIMMFKNDAERILFNSELHKYQDWDFAIRSSYNGLKFKFVNQVLVKYFIDSEDRIGRRFNQGYVQSFLMSVGHIVSDSAKHTFLVRSEIQSLVESGKYFRSFHVLYKNKIVGIYAISQLLQYILKSLLVTFFRSVRN